MGVDLVDHVDYRRTKDKLRSPSTLRKAIIAGVVLTAVAVILLNASIIIPLFQGCRKVIVSEGQLSIENFGTESSPRVISFIKDDKILYVTAGLTVQDIRTYVPFNGAVYHVNGFEIVVSEVHQSWFVLLVRTEW